MFGLIITMIVGYILNIIDLIGTAAAPLTGLFVARIVGIFIPFLGSLLGLFA